MTCKAFTKLATIGSQYYERYVKRYCSAVVKSFSLETKLNKTNILQSSQIFQGSKTQQTANDEAPPPPKVSAKKTESVPVYGNNILSGSRLTLAQVVL